MDIVIAITAGVMVVILLIYFLINRAWNKIDKRADQLINPQEKLPSPNIAVISINGILQYSDRPGSGFQKIMRQIAKVAKIKPKALIVRINSRGGTAGASHEIYEALMDLKKLGIKIVAIMEDIAASGGVYIAMAADKIIANPGTVTGSIGVIFSHLDLSRVFKKLKIKPDSIKAGEYKDMLSSSKPMKKKHRNLMKQAAKALHLSFKTIVAKSRDLTMDVVNKFADGRILTADQAKECRLIDEVGGYTTAVEAAAYLASITKGQEKVEAIDLPMSLPERFGLATGVTALSEQAEYISFCAKHSGAPLFIMK